MHLIVLGLNHTTAPVEVRERFSLSAEQIREATEGLTATPVIEEAAVISTCNRTEIYAAAVETGAALAVLQDFFAAAGRASAEGISQYFYWFIDIDCAEHLFRVASSLDSLVIGEGQILSQVKEAYGLSHGAGGCGTVLNLLFHRAIATGKRVRTETRIAFNAVSVSYAAVELVKKQLGSLEGLEVLLFGAGKMAELTARHLTANGIKKLYVANRHFSRAAEFAAEFGGEAVSFIDAFRRAAAADIVITSTGAPHYVVHRREVERLMEKREGRPVIFIDIAVPRDIEPGVAAIDGVTLCNIDSLTEIVEEHKRERAEEAELAGKIVYAELAAFWEKLKYLSCRPVMLELAEQAEQIRCRELRRVAGKLSGLKDGEWQLIEGMTRMITRKLLRGPMSRLARAAGTEQEEHCMQAARELFCLPDGEAEHEK